MHHLSSSHKRRFLGAGCKDQDITISVVHNPSHLEAANPVSQGKTKVNYIYIYIFKYIKIGKIG